VRRGSTWTQQGSKLVGTGADNSADQVSQGFSVALSGDGHTALVGGPIDAGFVGAVWIFVRVRGTWTQQGGKLVSSAAIGEAFQGASVALSADGNTALVGSPDNNAAWLFVRSSGTWTQQ
jgi:hypothetical protein